MSDKDTSQLNDDQLRRYAYYWAACLHYAPLYGAPYADFKEWVKAESKIPFDCYSHWFREPDGAVRHTLPDAHFFRQMVAELIPKAGDALPQWSALGASIARCPWLAARPACAVAAAVAMGAGGEVLKRFARQGTGGKNLAKEEPDAFTLFVLCVRHYNIDEDGNYHMHVGEARKHAAVYLEITGAALSHQNRSSRTIDGRPHTALEQLARFIVKDQQAQTTFTTTTE